MDTMKDTTMQPATDAVIEELLNRLEAEESKQAALLDCLNEWKELAKSAEKERDALRAENAALVDDMNLLRDNNTALRAKVAEMEKQEPVGCVESLFDDVVIIHNDFDRAAPVYLAPGAQPQLNEIKIALQRALELGQREAWTGVRKHRSWEDQREEQQCWDKVWSLLGAKGEC